MSPAGGGQALNFPAADGYALHGTYWHGPEKPVAAVLISAATGVAARYYHRFAEVLSRRGFRVLVYDYRGIGQSRPTNLRKLRASKLDWGALDCEGAIQALSGHADGAPLYAVCHSIGGFCLGMAPSAHRVQRALFVGCQYAYWRDYAPAVRMGFLWRWHLLMPVLASLLGYFPGKRLGWLEDLPRGVALEWGLRFAPAFHRLYRWLPHASTETRGAALTRRMARIQADLLALADPADEYATEPANRRLLAYFRGCRRQFATFASEPPAGHFGFFHDRYHDTLWTPAINWLLNGQHPWALRFDWAPENITQTSG